MAFRGTAAWAAVLGLLPGFLCAQAEWENPVKKLLREGKPVIGATITVASPEIAAQAANLGFDFLWIEMEHSPITLETVRNMILATRGLKAMPFTRVPVNELWTAKRVLDCGSLGVIFPFTSTPSWRSRRWRPANTRPKAGAARARAWPPSAGPRPKVTTNSPTGTPWSSSSLRRPGRWTASRRSPPRRAST